MAKPAIRNTDFHVCPAHGPEKIGAVVPMDVTVNNEATLNVGCCFTCAGVIAKAKTGAASVQLRGGFMVRAMDDSSHGGKFTPGSGTVVIGGPMGMGDIAAARKICEKIMAGRKSGSNAQSYENCGLEVIRQIVQQAKGYEVSEDEMLNYARLHKKDKTDKKGEKEEDPLCSDDDGIVNAKDGRTSGLQQKKLLEHFGVATTFVPPNGKPDLPMVKDAIAGNRGVLASVELKYLWGEPYNDTHAVLVTGVELDENGNVTGVFVTDTGAGACCQRYPAGQFNQALNHAPLVVTNEPIW